MSFKLYLQNIVSKELKLDGVVVSKIFIIWFKFQADILFSFCFGALKFVKIEICNKLLISNTIFPFKRTQISQYPFVYYFKINGCI